MHAILRGIDHTELDRIAATVVAPDLAIALSRGRAMKRYDYVDDNEDVVLACRDRRATALVVADGHNGHEGSHVAVDALASVLTPDIPVWDKFGTARVFHGVNERIREVRELLPGSHRMSRTTLICVTVTDDDEGGRVLRFGSVGDSAVFVVGQEGVTRLSRDRHYFLGDRYSAPQVAGAMEHGQTTLALDDVVVVVSDGFTNFAHHHDLALVRDRDPEQMARRIIDLAGQGGAGDNVAVAVLLPAAANTEGRT